MSEEIKTTTGFMAELSTLINRHSKENESDTPDFILAEYLNSCLNAFSAATVARGKWNGRPPVKCSNPPGDSQ